MKEAKFSVVTVSYQHADFIRQTIESVMLQSYPAVEHIVVDGGSTDGTLEILKAYPHLIWTSEPDRGQSHALNKGFARATGDIIAWINSDDWYPPGLFKDVALALEDYPIVMGSCEVCDKYGVRQHVVKNYERTWHDLLKYWVFCSSPAQPSIFFRREVLEEVKYAAGKYLDEDLEFCMDLDLWLRIAERYSLVRRMPKVFSYLRTYDTNKTGEMMDLTYREMSRVYERHARRRVMAETAHSVVIPAQEFSEGLLASVESFKKIPAKSAEMLVVDHGSQPEEAKRLRRKVLELARTVPHNTLRYVRASPGHQFEALTHAIKAVRSPILTVMQPGDVLAPDWIQSCDRAFERDNTALALMYGDDPKEKEQFLLRTEKGVAFRTDAIFVAPRILPNFVARTVALLELGGFKGSAESEGTNPLCAMRQLLLRILYKGWAILGEHTLRLPQHSRPFAAEEALLPVFQLYINAQMIVDLVKESKLEPFFEERSVHQFTIVFPENISSSAEKLMQTVPLDWADVLLARGDRAKLESWVQRAPQFIPAWMLLGEIAESGQDMQLAERVQSGMSAAQANIATL